MSSELFEKTNILKMSYASLQKYNEKASRDRIVNIVKNLSSHEITSSIVSWVARNDISIDGMYSFKRSLSERRVFGKDFKTKYSEWALNEKIAAYDFVSNFDIEVPDVTLSHASLEQVEQIDFFRKVLKPSAGAGARHVYLIYEEDRIFSLTDKRFLEKKEMLGLISKSVKEGGLRNKFNVEQLMTEDAKGTPSRDLKFYCFYGTCGLILEIIRGEKVKYCFHNRLGDIVNTGKYTKSSFKGDGVTEQQILLAERVSQEIPCPFIRIDFLKSDSNAVGMVFGEFTPAPGSYDAFNKETDILLGKMWAKAQNDLFNDLMAGKEFKFFERLSKR